MSEVTGQMLAAARDAAQIFAAAAGFPGADAELLWADAARDVMRLLIHRVAAARALPAPELPVVHIDPGPMTAGCRALMRIEDVRDWSAPELGSVYEQLLAARPGQTRETQGSWFTPQPVAQAVTRLALDTQLDRLARSDDPLDMLQVLALDPACGAGVFLLEAARHIAARFALRQFGHASTRAIRAVMPDILTECVFGIDIDPIAIEIARTSLWLEASGAAEWGFMDRNVICGNALEQDEPPKLAERLGHRGPQGEADQAAATRPAKETAR